MLRFVPLVVVTICCVGCGGETTRVVTQTSENEMQLGREAFERKDYEEAAKLFDGALRRGGLNADLGGEALLMRAKACIKLGRLDDAQHDLEDASRGPVPPDEVLSAKGDIALKQGDLDKARSLYVDARKLNPTIALPDKLK